MATKIGNFNLTIPAWELSDLQTLSSEGDLSGVNPDILAVMDQSESSGEGGGVAGNGDGGWYGLQSAATYTAPNGTAFKTTPALISGTTTQDFDEQSEIAAAEIAHLIDEYGGNVTEAEEKYQGGSTEGATNLASAGLAGPVSSSSLSQDAASGPNQGSTSGSSSTTSATTDTGASGIFQDLNDLLNPSGGSLITQLSSLGTSDIAALVETVFVRGIFAIGFVLITYAAIKTLSGSGGGGGTSVVQLYNQEANRSIKRGDQAIAQSRASQGQQQRIDVASQRESRLGKTGVFAAADDAAIAAV